MGKSLSAITISDFKVVPPAGGLTSDYSVHVYTLDDAGQIDGDYVYLDESNIHGVDAGWYTTESVEVWSEESADDVTIAFGRGVMILSDCGAKIICSGEVYGQDFDVEIVDEVSGGNTFTGNCSPVDRQLLDFAVTPPAGGLTSDYSVHAYTLDDAGQIEGDYVYLDDSNIHGVEPGWYTTESVEIWSEESAGDVTIAAGRLLMILSDCGATITIPSAL